MKLIHRIRNVWAALKAAIAGKPKWGKETDYPVEFAFHWNGKDYFYFVDPHNVPYQRGLVAMSYMEEVNMRITRDFLEYWVNAMKTEMNRGANIRMLEVARMMQMIEDRMNWVIEPDTLYKIASVMFFTKEESVLMYDVVYNREKIKEWKQTNTKFDFFLQVPFQELFPFLTQSHESIIAYFSSGQAKMIEDFVTLRQVLSQSKSQSDLLKRLDLQIAELMESISTD